MDTSLLCHWIFFFNFFFFFSSMQQSFPVKLTVRRLPANLTQDVFESVLGRLCRFEAKLLYFVPGFVKRRNRSAWARAYLLLPSPKLAEEFHLAFTNIWPSLEIPFKVVPQVEPSPFQKVPPPEEPRPDPLSDTLDTYAPFQAFLQELQKEKTSLPSADVQLERRQASLSAAASKQPIISPLLKELMERKLAQLERDRAQMARAAPRTVAQRPGGAAGAKEGGRGRGRGGNDGTKKKRGPRRQGRRNKPKKPAE